MIQERNEDGILIITFEGPMGNSITRDDLEGLNDVVTRVNEDDALKGIVITGAGKTFSSGFNLPMFLGFKDLDEVADFFTVEEEILLNFFTCKKPVVSAINGHAVAMGLILSMAADYRIAKNHPKIKIGMSEIKIGLPLSIAQDGVMRYGLNSARDFRNVMFFGENIDPETALQRGIIDELAEDDESLINRAKEVIRLWIDNPGRTFIPMKELWKHEALQGIRERMKAFNQKERLKIFFDPGTRKALEGLVALMGGGS